MIHFGHLRKLRISHLPLTVAVDDDQLVLDSVVGFGTSDSLEDERSMSREPIISLQKSKYAHFVPKHRSSTEHLQVKCHCNRYSLNTTQH